MNRSNYSSMGPNPAVRPMSIQSSLASSNNVRESENINHRSPTPRVNSSVATAVAKVDMTRNAAITNKINTTGPRRPTSNRLKLRPQTRNIRSLVFDLNDVCFDLQPLDDENASPIAGSNKRLATDDIPVLHVKKLHVFRTNQMPVYWDITNLKPSKVTRHLRCLLLTVESRPTFDQIRQDYDQVRDYFCYSYGFLQIHSATSDHQGKLQALYQTVFDNLHALLALADRVEANGGKGEAQSPNPSKRPRVSK